MGTKSTHEPVSQQDEWLSLQEASSMLGVATSTLRRWGDIGRVPMKKTLGGHRRFSRPAVLQLLHDGEPQPPAPPGVPHWGIDVQQLARQDWHVRLAARSDARRLRGVGQRLLGLLIQYINSQDTGRFIDEARSVGMIYGHEAREVTISMHDTVEAFLFFRGAFSQLASPQPGLDYTSDIVLLTTLRARIDRFMDAVLLGVIAGYEEQGQPEAHDLALS